MKKANNLVSLIISDIIQYSREPSLKTFFKLYISNPGFRVVVLIRLITADFSIMKHLRKVVRIHILRSYGFDFSLGCIIESGLRIDHPVGIVIGKGVYIGQNCYIGQGVTIGEKYIDSRSDGKYPTLGNSVMVGAGSAIIGKVSIGNNVTIGARSLVLKDVPHSSTVYGTWN
jgi:serine O-acetyltransferase